jgi:hypothetical protein
MRIGFLKLALIIVVSASLTPIAFVKAQQPRNQAQSQEGLSEQKKKALSRFSPEDIFGAGDDSRSRGTGTGSRQQRRGSPTPTPSSSSTRQTAQPTVAQPPAPQASTPSVQPTAAAPSPTIPAATLSAGAQQSSLSQGDSSDKIDSKWASPVLIAMALAVTLALVYTLTKLVEKIKEGSSG